MSYTKGEWKMNFPFVYQKNNYGSYRFHITINTEGHKDNGDYTEREELEANARLIAAAPDLLKACEKVQDWLDTSSLQKVLVHCTDAKEKDALIMGVASHLERLEAAISKAKPKEKKHGDCQPEGERE